MQVPSAVSQSSPKIDIFALLFSAVSAATLIRCVAFRVDCPILPSTSAPATLKYLKITNLNVSFTKAVFSAHASNDTSFNKQSDYLIHSISYKEVSEGDSTTIVGSDEVAFKISTSNIPDPSKYDFKTTFPTAHVKIVDGANNIVFEGDVNLDKDGKAIRYKTKYPIIFNLNNINKDNATSEQR